MLSGGYANIDTATRIRCEKVMNTGTVLRMFSGRSRWNLQPNEFSLAIERQRSSASGVLDLTASNPTTVGFDYDEEAILSAMNNRKSLTYERQRSGRALLQRGTAGS